MSAEAEVTRLQKENEALRQVFQRLAGGAKVEDLEDLMKQSKPKQPKEMKKEHEVLFTPISIAGCQLKNRFALAPLGPAGLSDANGAFTQRAVDYYVERARGGTALIMTGIVKVENEIEKCPPVLPCATQCPGAFLQTLRVMAERVHSYGAKLFVQLTAGFGRVAIYPGLVSSYPVSASAIPNRWHPEIICKELTTEQVQTYVKKFAEAAAICQHAGVDGVEVHAVHEGYLLDQFAIAMFNHRTDQYGGSLENRLRFATEIVQAIKAACGKTYPVSLRLSLKSYIKDWCQGALPGEKFEEKGRDMPEGLEAAKLLEKAGYDAFNSDCGTYDAWYWAHPPQYQAKGLYLPMNEQLKKVVHVPVITAGRMEDPDLASKAIVNHQTDMIGLGRPLLADPEVPNKIRAGDFGAVRPCISCQEGCIGRLAVYAQISCAVNPACARERDYGLLPTIRRKHVIVVGGGVAGMETARVAAVRGHRVDLYERSQRLGGLLIPAGIPDFKEDERRLVAWYERVVAEAGVNVHLGQEIDAAGILAAGADTVVFATGSRPKIFDFAGAKNVFTAEDVLEGKRDAGKKTVMVGGGVTGCETALWLRSKGTEVTIVEFRDKILEPGPLCMANKTMLEDLVHFKGVTVHTSSKVIAPAQGGFEVEGPDGKHFVVPADSAVLAVGSSSERKLFEEVSKKSGAEVFLIGDANHVGNIMSAIWDAYEIARSL